MSDISVLFDRLQLSDCCTICFDTIRIEDKSFIENCGHPFCYNCILKWCQEKLTCPLCVRPFRYIIYNLTSETEYEVRDLIADPVPSTPELQLVEVPVGSQHSVHYWFSIWLSAFGHWLSAMHVRHNVPYRHYTAIIVDIPQAIPYRKRVYIWNLLRSNRNLAAVGIRLFTPKYYRDHRSLLIRISTWIDRDWFLLNELLSVTGMVFDEELVLMWIMNLLLYHGIQSDILMNFIRHFTGAFIRELFEFAISSTEVFEYDKTMKQVGVHPTDDYRRSQSSTNLFDI